LKRLLPGHWKKTWKIGGCLSISRQPLAAGVIAAEQRRQGRPVEIRDVQIAGIAVARKAALATRNIRHFEGIGITLINPWKG
jgi:predicted nucleic acid-binding protein